MSQGLMLLDFIRSLCHVSIVLDLRGASLNQCLLPEAKVLGPRLYNIRHNIHELRIRFLLAVLESLVQICLLQVHHLQPPPNLQLCLPWLWSLHNLQDHLEQLAYRKR
jgi:hypothetical protein